MRRFFEVISLVFSVAFILVMFSPNALAGTIIHVPGDQPTIQDGINGAVNGDTVLVSPGTYYENINFNGKAITVTSASGPAVTVIDGSASFNPVVTFAAGETIKSVISGFTLRNGDSEEVSVSGASPTIQGNIMIGTVQFQGNGVNVQSGGGVIQGNLISGQYNGIAVTSGTGVQILGNLMADNLSAGINVQFSSAADVVQQNTVVNNAQGIFYYYPAANPSLIQNLVSGNHSAGLEWIASGNSFVLISNTIAANAPNCCGNSASELQAYPIDGATLENNLIVATGNWPAADCTSSTGPAKFTNNDVFSSGSSAYTSQCPDPTGTNGNISSDPLFVDTLAGNYHLQSASPVIKAGTTSAANEPKTDFDGDSRIIANSISMGADEYSAKPRQAVSTFALHFGDQDVGTTSSPQTVNLINNRKNAIAINLIAISPGFSQTNNCSSSLPAASSCQISVSFSPLAGGVNNGVLGIFTNATRNPEAVTLLGTGFAPQINVGCCFSFFDQVVGTSSIQSQTLSNTGQAPLLISSIAYSGSSSLSESNTCPIAPNTLAAGSSCTLNVTFTPLVPGGFVGTISISSNAGPPLTLNVSGSSVSAGNAVLTPTSLTFPATLIGQSSAPQTFTLSNTGTGPLGITQIYSSGDFPQTNNCPTSLPVGASCTFTVTYTPSFQGSDFGNVYIYTDSANSLAFESFNGTGTAPVPAISSLSVSNAPEGAADTLVVMSGTGFVNSSQVLWNGVPLTYCCVTVLGNTQIQFTIPAALMTAAGMNQISVSTPAPGGGTSNTVPFPVFAPINYAEKSVPYRYRTINGTNLNLFYGSTAVITSPFPIQFGGGSFTTLSVGSSGTVSFSYFGNAGNTSIPTSLTSTLVAPFWAPLYPFGSGTDNNVFWQVTGFAPNRELVIEWRDVGICCETTNTIRFEVVFFEGNSNILFNYANTVFGGSYSSNDNAATATVGVQVTPTVANQFSYNQPSLSSKSALLWYPNNPTATLSTSSVGFGYHQIGTPALPQRITLTNAGLTALNITSIATDNPDFSQTNTCGSSLAQHHSCSIRLVFKPSQPMLEIATLTLIDNGANSPQTVTLTGTGTPTALVVFPVLVNFGSVAVNSTATAPVTLVNAGNQALTVQQIATTKPVYAQTNNCGTSVAPGLSCTISVTFTPVQTGSVQAGLTMALNGKKAQVESKLTGSGQ